MAEEVFFNKNDYKILEALIERECNSPVASLTIKQLINITQMSLSKVRSVKDKFILTDYIQEGSKDGNEKTFFYTHEGLIHFKNIFGFADEDIENMVSDFNNKDENREE